MKLVLDATAIRSGMTFSGEFEWYMTPSVKDEVMRGKLARDLELLADISIKIMEPSPDILEKIRRTAGETGDIGRLSDTDVDVLALGLELRATILSDDYSIQNVAKVLGIDYKGGAEKGITEVYNWHWRCRGCGRFFDEEAKECPVCGSGLRSVRKKKQ